MNTQYLKECLAVGNEALKLGRCLEEFDLSTVKQLPDALKPFEKKNDEDWYYSTDIQDVVIGFNSDDIEQWKYMLDTVAVCMSILSDWHVEEITLETPLPDDFGVTNFDEYNDTHSTYRIGQCLADVADSLAE